MVDDGDCIADAVADSVGMGMLPLTMKPGAVLRPECAMNFNDTPCTDHVPCEYLQVVER